MPGIRHARAQERRRPVVPGGRRCSGVGLRSSRSRAGRRSSSVAGESCTPRRPTTAKVLDLVAALGAQLHRTIPEGLGRAPDIIVEATGDTDVVRDVLTRAPSDSLTCLLGVTHGPRRPTGRLRAMNDGLVQHNELVFGSVHANLSHYALALNALRSSEQAWLRAMITRQVTLDDGDQVLQTSPEDVTTMLTFPVLHEDPPAGDRLAGAHAGGHRAGVAPPGR